MQKLKGDIFYLQNNNIKVNQLEHLIDGLETAKEIDLKNNNIGFKGI